MFGRIIGTGSYIPEKVITNDDLAKYVDTSDEWIIERTGIKKRHIMKDETTADMAVEAARKAVEDAGIPAEEIDMIIVSSVSSNLILPNTACFVQEQIGAENASCMDINTACTGFITAYNTVQSYIHAGLIEMALIVCSEGLSNLVDWKDRGTCILFGDGAGAAIIKKDESAVFDTVMKSDGRKGSSLTCSNGFANRKRLIAEEEEKDYATYIQMDGQEVYRFATRRVPQCIEEALSDAGLAVPDIDMFVLHQANARIIDAVAKRLHADRDKFPTNLERVGNMSSASIPVLLDELHRQGKLHCGDRIVLAGFGAGLTIGACVMTW